MTEDEYFATLDLIRIKVANATGLIEEVDIEDARVDALRQTLYETLLAVEAECDRLEE